MNKLPAIKSAILFFLASLFIFKISVLTTGCANMIPPTGGPRDSLPPTLVRIYPVDSSKNFNQKTITFVFDEFIDQPQDITQNLIISPTPLIQPVVEAKLRTLTVRIKDTLEPNTTYYYNFGKAIKDVNEGNVLNNLTYIFSTGNTIDSLEFTGNVLLAETGGIDSTLIVMLHRNGDDSAVVNERPRYITKLDNKGNFRFKFLQQGTYYLYALKDESGARRYFSTSQLFAFAEKPIEIKPGAEPVTLYAFAEKKAAAPATTISFTGNRGAGAKADDKRLKYGTNLSASTQDLLNDLVLTFDTPLKTLDTTQMHLSTDTLFVPEPVQFETDTLNKKLTLKVKWKEGTQYNLVIDNDFAEDSTGRKLQKSDTLRFKTKNISDYGLLKISFTNLDLTKNPVLQFSQSNQVTKTFPLAGSLFYQALFSPGEYELSILYDDNKNKRWDPGDFFSKHLQPELVKPLNKKITIRADWENEFDINL